MDLMSWFLVITFCAFLMSITFTLSAYQKSRRSAESTDIKKESNNNRVISNNNHVICKPHHYELVKPFLKTQFDLARSELSITESSNINVLKSLNNSGYFNRNKKPNKESFLERYLDFIITIT